MAALHFLDDFDIDELVQRFGSPLFVFSARTMENTIRSMQRAFCSRYADTKFVWPYKTNYLGAILDLVHAEGLGAEIVS